MRKTLILTLGMALSCVSLNSCICSCADTKTFSFGKDVIKISKDDKIVTKQFDVKSFDRISSSYSIDVEYVQGPQKVVVTAPEKLMSMLDVSVSNSTLNIGFSNTRMGISIDGDIPYKAVVSSPSLRQITSKGSGDILLKGNIKIESLEATVSGSGDIRGDEIQAGNASFTSNGSGDINIRSLAGNDISLEMRGSGDIEIANLSSKNLTGSTSGSGDMKMNINCEIAELSTNGSGDITVSGECLKAVLRTLGSGDINAKKLNCRSIKAIERGSGDIKTL